MEDDNINNTLDIVNKYYQSYQEKDSEKDLEKVRIWNNSFYPIYKETLIHGFSEDIYSDDIRYIIYKLG